MIHDSIEFHNAAALEPLHGMPGLCPVRYPQAVRHHLNPSARRTGIRAVGVELRFASSAAAIVLTFAAHDEDVRVRAMRGSFDCAEWTIPAGQIRVLTLIPPERFPLVTPDSLNVGGFSPELWRVRIIGGTVSYLGCESHGAEVRPPAPGETPALRWLAYGSSITHADGAFGYVHQAARILEVDVLNKGLSGSCHIEPEVGSHFATEEQWDFATLELGVNMRGHFTPDVFQARARGLVERLHQNRLGTPLVLITHFHNLQHHPLPSQMEDLTVKRQQAFDEILRQIAAEQAGNGVYLLEGTEILPSLDGLTADLLHPSADGHRLMGARLAEKLHPLIDALRSGQTRPPEL